MTQFLDQAKGHGPLVDYLTEGVRRVLLVFLHGLGDVVMLRAPLASLRAAYPGVRFEVGVCPGYEGIIPGGVPLQGDWRRKGNYDLVYTLHFPMENLRDWGKTKGEICCVEELGIDPAPGHPPLAAKPLVAVHFHTTSVPELSGADERTAERVWGDIKAAGCVPIETHFEHSYANPANARFPFVDFHVRGCQARVEHLASLLACCHAFVGVVSGNFHLAMSLLPPERVFLLERKLRAGHFTKQQLATAALDEYNGQVKTWLLQMGANNV
jgi:hypothetical protein